MERIITNVVYIHNVFSPYIFHQDSSNPIYKKTLVSSLDFLDLLYF